MMVVKWAIFLVAVMVSWSAGKWLRDRPKARLYAWTLVGALPFLAPDQVTSLIFFYGFPSDIHGIDVTLIDLVALALLVASKPTRRPLPYRVPLLLYFLVVVLAVSQARWTVPALGYPAKLLRMAFLLLTIWRAGNEDTFVPPAIIRGMLLGLVYVSVLGVWQRFGLHHDRATGSFYHQNILGGMVNLVSMVPIARLLNGRTSRLTKLAPALGLVVSFLTVSRGALLFLGLGAVIVYVGSSLNRFSSRKASIGLVGLVLGGTLAVAAITVIDSRRSAGEREESMEARAELESAASSMLHDHPLGVGPGFYITELLLGGYGARAGLGWRMRTALAHNIYWLIAAEMGYAGFVTLLLVFLAPLALAFRYALGRGRERQRDILLGLGASLAIFYIHCLYESLWRRTEVTYTWFMMAGMIAVVAQQIRAGPPGRLLARRGRGAIVEGRAAQLARQPGVRGSLAGAQGSSRATTRSTRSP